MPRRACIAIIISLLALSFLGNGGAFAQGREYLRTRSGTLAASEGDVESTEAYEIEYFIVPEDEMQIFVWQNPDLTKDVIVGPDGYISFPLVGRVRAIGLTPAQLEEKFKERLGEFIKFPQVSVMMKKYAGSKIIVLGEVYYPGIYTYKGTIDLIEALALAGDFTDDAHKDSVIVVSDGTSEKPKARRVNMVRAISRGAGKKIDISLKPNDVVFVPRTFISNLNKFLSDASTLLTDVDRTLAIRKEIRRLGGRSR